ncbi:type III restriction enzyme [Pedobacter psychrotolerans]|uniref:Type III restriction endonuclease n=1 Tax=Pedobacter psychrotolerans TaxID=1843235 RepID=A0A4R2H807_9SPHI|nr:DEAD/DEAH box helicase family protein [Pedobacter psychrotolerans]TCO22643.1 type III restriction enzyme [Pedobacter psychrotolerans]GGE66034.1 type III restriction endonuclease [Pedobacter psychrotolerans]
MELKNYQSKVIQDLETYLNYIKQYKKTDQSFNQFWEDRIGSYNALTGEGMQPYKNTIPNAANVCIKVPTAGGKTFIACNALHTVFSAYPLSMPKVVVWLVPWSNLLDQTVAALSSPDHPYRQKLNSLFNHRVEIYQKKDLLQGANFNPSIVQKQLSIFVMSFASLRAKNKEDRKVYQENGQLASFASFFKSSHHFQDDTEETSLINVIRNLQPVVVVDESHNAESALSIDMLRALNPSFVLDLTATPKNNSNIISMVPAIELKKENMVKLPVIVYNHHDRTAVVNSAFHLQRRLELLAVEQEKTGGRYIRPIVLFQAQPNTGDENVTYEKLKKQLISIGIPENQVKIKTATMDELKGIDLMSSTCEVRFIITINALKEGWDCPFAYILASLADKSSAVDVEQILGRVLRQPYVQKHKNYLLNVSYVLTASVKFNDTLQSIVKGLQSSGFSDNDYRGVDMMERMDNSEQIIIENKQLNLTDTVDIETEIDLQNLNFDKASVIEPVVNHIEKVAFEQSETMQQLIASQKTQINDDHIFEEMGEKIRRYRLIEQHKKHLIDLKLPKFYLHTTQNSLFSTGKISLSQEPLLNQFKLSNEDIKIDFNTTSSDLYKVDLEEVGKNDFDARFSKIEDLMFREPVVAYIMSKPPERQIKDIVHQLMKIIGDMYPIPDQEIRLYIERVLSSLNPEQLQDILTRKDDYSKKIKARIKHHADGYAEQRFNDMIKLGKINTEPAWTFPEQTVPGNVGASISKSLYEREGTMNGFETTVISAVSALQNIVFWHRNLSKGKGFNINGFKSNHYPDFILYTKSGRIILLETKGDDRDNSDSRSKCRLGNKWAELAGEKFNYFMVFEQNQIEGAFSINKSIELIKEL